MKPLVCIAIDDEPKALEVIASHCAKVPFLELKANFRDPLEAVAYMKSEPVDLVFLDINMPRVTGLQFLTLLRHQPMVVFVTAYSEYAVDSYEYEAVDYLLKPIAFDRFLKAATKALDRAQTQINMPAVTPASTEKAQQFLYLKSGPKLHKLSFSDILFVEKDGNYLNFHTAEQKILSRQNMKHIFQILPESEFARVHRSFVINLARINTIESHQLIVAGNTIPLSSQYREELMEKIGQ